MINPENYQTPKDFQRAVISRLIDRKVEKGLISRDDANQRKQQAIQAAGLSVYKKSKKKA